MGELGSEEVLDGGGGGVGGWGPADQEVCEGGAGVDRILLDDQWPHRRHHRLMLLGCVRQNNLVPSEVRGDGALGLGAWVQTVTPYFTPAVICCKPSPLSVM